MKVSYPSFLHLSSLDRKALDSMLASIGTGNSIGYQRTRRSSKNSLSRTGDGQFLWTLQRGEDQYNITVSLSQPRASVA